VAGLAGLTNWTERRLDLVEVRALGGFVQLHDVKALWSHGKVGVQEDANIKMKVAASQYPYFQFLTVWKEKNGMWNKKTY